MYIFFAKSFVHDLRVIAQSLDISAHIYARLCAPSLRNGQAWLGWGEVTKPTKPAGSVVILE